jgi:hypothetical protein
MKNVFFGLVALTFLLNHLGCSNDPPLIRVNNQRATKANIQIKQSTANTINHNDVAPGTFSNYQEIAEGATEVTAEIQDESVSPTAAFNASEGTEYTVVVLSGDPPSLRVDN